ncbi:hypothetical protein M9H77_23343 [Catharanthus roseus]|uniref:Uncharacterized protein n=1 Tax=Catharanthus roseus TaxID=4058 RepID=A0ACC0AUK2_CATRO|nr:hypothetical protein M9H77_23343 [Catharanthus roseus]
MKKEECNEIKEKERVENKERLVERLYIFDSISIISKESELLECSKEKETRVASPSSDPVSLDLVKGTSSPAEAQCHHWVNGLENVKILWWSLSCVPYVSKCLSSHAFLEDSLLHNGSMFDLSCYDFRVMDNAFNESMVVGFGLYVALFYILHDKCLGKVMDNASIESMVVGFGLYVALFYILHDKCLGKFVENVGYASSFRDTFLENHNDFVSSNQRMTFKCRPSWNAGNFMFTFSHLILCNTIGEKRCFYAKVSEFMEFIEKDELVSLLYCKKELARIVEGNELEVKIAKSLKRSTLLPMATLPLPLPVGFCRPKFLFLYSINPRSSSLYSWEALVSSRSLLVKETHCGVLMGHFGISKTYDNLHEHFFWLGIKRDTERLVHNCLEYKRAISTSLPHRPYISLNFPREPRVDISMEFILELLRFPKSIDSTCVMVYLYDISIDSKTYNDHLHHFNQVFLF